VVESLGKADIEEEKKEKKEEMKPRRILKQLNWYEYVTK